MTAGAPIWEKQEFDTPKSYQMFLSYYFPQEQPRSVNEAYRAHKPLTQAQLKKSGGIDNRAAPSNWRRWAQGKDPRGREKIYQELQDDGEYIVKRVPTWAERAEAWDLHLASIIIEAQRVDEQQMANDTRALLKVALGKIKMAWDSYKPTGNERLPELATATSKVVQDLGVVFDLWAAVGDDEGAVRSVADDGVTDGERVDKITDILSVAMARRQQAGAEEKAKQEAKEAAPNDSKKSKKRGK